MCIRDRDKPIDLSTGLNFVRSNDPKFKKIPGFNQELDYIPSETLVYKVDSATAVAKGLATDSTGLLKEMTISLKGKTALGKQELMILDMLQTNNWERPIYYAITVNPDQFVGLDGYFEQTGLAYQIVPKQANKGTNTEKMYDLYLIHIYWVGTVGTTLTNWWHANNPNGNNTQWSFSANGLSNGARGYVSFQSR